MKLVVTGIIASAALAAVWACHSDDPTPNINAKPEPAARPTTPVPQAGQTLTGQAAFGDWSTDAPGVRRKIVVADLPEPFETRSVDNGPRMYPRPDGAWPKVPAGFKVDLYATG